MIKLYDLLLEISLEDMEKAYLNSGKISPKQYDDVKSSHKIFMDEFKNTKTADQYAQKIAIWYSKGMMDESQYEDVVSALLLFKKDKRKFTEKNINVNSINTKNNLEAFLSRASELEGFRSVSTGDKRHVSANEIEKLQNVGINLLGVVDGYQVFNIPQSLIGDKEAWNAYRNILGQCDRQGGKETTSICTIANFNHFNTYLRKDKDGFFLIFNLGDKLSPYQIIFGNSPEFKNKNDEPLAPGL